VSVAGASYSRWDGSQQGFDLDADAILAEINDDVMYHGDVGAALRRIMQQGFSDRDGKRIAGLRELLERLRERRRQEQEDDRERRHGDEIGPPSLSAG